MDSWGTYSLGKNMLQLSVLPLKKQNSDMTIIWVVLNGLFTDTCS